MSGSQTRGKRYSLEAIIFLLSSLCFLGLLPGSIFASQEELIIKGKVLDTLNRPIPGASVLEKRTGRVAETDASGAFELKVTGTENFFLEASHPEYIEQEVTVNSRSLNREVVIILRPMIKQREEIVVTAMRYPEPSSQIPAASTVIEGETLARDLVPNITEGLADIPGVAPLGSGGFSLVPSIRGMARRRVLIMIDNARIISDRRTGPNASFLSPEDVEKIELIRSPSSVFYGSDAIGGVINILTRRPKAEDRIGGNLSLRYGTNNQEKGVGLTLFGRKGAAGFFLSFQTDDAENYSTPREEVFQSQFTQSSLLAKIEHDTEKRYLALSFLGARGRNIGKPSRDSQTKPTWYPREDQNLVQLKWVEKNIGGGELSFHAFINPNFLETRTDTISGGIKTKESFSRTESTELGIHLNWGRQLTQNLRLNTGFDLFGREKVQAVNRDKNLNSLGQVTSTFEEHPFTDGKRRDTGFFLSFDLDGLPGVDLAGGIRVDRLFQQARPGGGETVAENSRTSVTGFLGVSGKLTKSLIVFGNLARAYRAPGLSERFYTGITGRGFIISQPNLKPESSLNLDAGIKLIGKRLFLGIYGFQYRVQDLIERYKVAERLYTYGNVDRGRLRGMEGELEFYPLAGWSLFSNLTAIEGQSLKTKQPLNDVPPFRLHFGSRFWWKRLMIEGSGAFQAKKDNPGPAEIEIDQATYFTFKASYEFSRLRFQLLLRNAFDAFYLGRPDPDAKEEPGRNLLLRVSYSF